MSVCLIDKRRRGQQIPSVEMPNHTKQVECDYMLSALRRMELRGHLNEIYDGVIVNKKEGNAA